MREQIIQETRKVTYNDLSGGLKTAIVITWVLFGLSIMGFVFGIIGAFLP